MKRQVVTLWVVGCLLFGLAACRVRVDFTKVQENTTPTTTTLPQINDEMASEAWAIYSRAQDIEKSYTSYELEYEGREKAIGKTAISKARFVRVEKDGAVSLWIEKEYGTQYSSAYFADGIGYFHIEGKKYWMPTDEETVYKVLKISETESLAEEMFTKAIVVKDEKGGATVSCPLQAKFAQQYARMLLGDSIIGYTVTRAEAGVTVDADGNPLVFTSVAAVNHAQYGTVSMESENRYVAVGDAVVLTPPSDLDSYTSMIG